MKRRIAVVLGGGAESAALALMGNAGEFGDVPEIAVFPDTQAESRAIYDYIDYLRTVLRFPVVVVSNGNLEDKSLLFEPRADGSLRPHCKIPAFVSDGKRAKQMRAECVVKYKLLPIRRFLNSWRDRRPVELWLAVPASQVSRMCESGVSWLTHRYPLIERGLSSADCIKWLISHEHHIVRRPGCYFCPYWGDYWWGMPDEQCAEAARYESMMQRAYEEAGIVAKGKGPWLHRSCKPLLQAVEEIKVSSEAFYRERWGLCGL